MASLRLGGLLPLFRTYSLSYVSPSVSPSFYHLPCLFYSNASRAHRAAKKALKKKQIVQHTPEEVTTPPENTIVESVAEDGDEPQTEVRRKSTVERRAEKFGERVDTKWVKKQKDKSKKALLIQKEREERQESESQDLDEVRSGHGTKLSSSKASRIKQIEKHSKNVTSEVAPSLRKFYPKKTYEFSDKAVVHVKAGNGGSGAVSFATGKYIRTAPADGGNGGRGGDIIIQADPSFHDMGHVRRRLVAKNGLGGQGGRSSGKNGEDLVLRVPLGTQFIEMEPSEEEGGEAVQKGWIRGEVIIDIEKPDDRITIAQGGKGGRGNFSFMSSVNKSPKKKELGTMGEEKMMELELKTMADVGFVGYPNAGKSTLLSVLSNAKPKIMPYAFTTLGPQVGVLDVDESKRITLADLPGIIDGAHEDKGLGLEFLRHIERTKVMCYVIDMAGTERKYPWKDYFSLREEVGHYNSKLLRRPTVIVANKMDLPNAQTNLVLFKDKVKLRAQRERRLVPSIYAVSGKMASDLPPLIEALAGLVTDPTIPAKPVFVFQEDHEAALKESENGDKKSKKDKRKEHTRDKKDKKAKKFKASPKWKGE